MIGLVVTDSKGAIKEMCISFHKRKPYFILTNYHWSSFSKTTSLIQTKCI